MSRRSAARPDSARSADDNRRVFAERWRGRIPTDAAERWSSAGYDVAVDRATGRLLVQGAFGEPGIDEAYVAAELACELASMAGWLDLDRGVEVMSRGDLAGALTVASTAVSSRGG